jgi:hypothetical protein
MVRTGIRSVVTKTPAKRCVVTHRADSRIVHTRRPRLLEGHTAPLIWVREAGSIVLSGGSNAPLALAAVLVRQPKEPVADQILGMRPAEGTTAWLLVLLLQREVAHRGLSQSPLVEPRGWPELRSHALEQIALPAEVATCLRANADASQNRRQGPIWCCQTHRDAGFQRTVLMSQEMRGQP